VFEPDDAQRLAKLRRALASRSPRGALKQLVELLAQYPTNRAFLDVITL